MLSLLQIDNLGKRYGLLPSEVLRKADTFDLYVLDAIMTYELLEHKKQKNKGMLPAEAYTTDTLLKLVQQSKDARDKNTK